MTSDRVHITSDQTDRMKEKKNKKRMLEGGKVRKKRMKYKIQKRRGKMRKTTGHFLIYV